MVDNAMTARQNVGGAFVPRLILTALLFAGVCAARAQTYQGRELVQAKLLSDVSAVVPGKPFTARLLLHTVPSRHTYWKSLGDAGMPTELQSNLQAGAQGR